MSVIKMAIYGALGYLVYQTFFAEKGLGQGGGGGGRLQQQRSGAGQTAGMTGTGPGQLEETSEASGTSARHRVGRGVV